MAELTGPKNNGNRRQTNVVAIIPAYNEERFIGSVVLKARKFASAVIVVDDGSSDATAEVAEAAGATLVRHTANQGKGAALNTGLSHARKLKPDVVVTLDGDGQHLPKEIDQVVAPVLAKQADIVVGSRYLEKKCQVPLHRVWGHHVFNFLINQTSGVALTDSQSGFRALSPRALQTISFRSNGFSVESEMQFLACLHNLRLVEAPVTILYQDRPKRPVVAHGMMVLNGLLKLVRQHRPLLLFGPLSLIALCFGLLWGVWTVDAYLRTQTLSLGHILSSMLLFTIGNLSLFAGITLHTVRGLLFDALNPKDVKQDPIERGFRTKAVPTPGSALETL